jgi:hypothetical protein
MRIYNRAVAYTREIRVLPQRNSVNDDDKQMPAILACLHYYREFRRHIDRNEPLNLPT